MFVQVMLSGELFVMKPVLVSPSEKSQPAGVAPAPKES